jgi:dephospho-CoA kinase
MRPSPPFANPMRSRNSLGQPGSDVCLVVGVSGPIAAGKTLASRYLEENFFSYARFSAVIDDMLREADLPMDRSHRQAMGEQVNRSPGQRWLCRELLRRVSDDARLIVIDGLRFPEDHAFFVEWFGPRFLHLHVTATRGTREARYIQAGGAAKDFRAAESALTELQHDRMALLAHVIVENQADRRQFWEKTDRAIGAARLDLGGLLCQ